MFRVPRTKARGEQEEAEEIALDETTADSNGIISETDKSVVEDITVGDENVSDIDEEEKDDADDKEDA